VRGELLGFDLAPLPEGVHVQDGGLQRFVYASSSAVYGRAEPPTREDSPTRPHSPYDLSKLAGEHLGGRYPTADGVPTVALRYFTVYGSRQRPGMALHRSRALRADRPSDGRQTRDFTFVGDVVDATCRASERAAPPGEGLTVAGGSRIELGEAIGLIERLTGRPAGLKHAVGAPGQMPHTYGNVSRAADHLRWSPTTALADGLRAEIAGVERVEAAGGFAEHG
jgi:UDP-glucose 4-epimerase